MQFEKDPFNYNAFDVVVIGGSMGGVHALTQLLPHIPKDFPAAIVIAHHMRRAQSYLVSVCQRHSRLPVSWAGEGDKLRPGSVVIAVPDRHLLIRPDRTLFLSMSPPVNYARPAVDLLFESAAMAFQDRTIGVVLTGAGKDGAVGARAIKNMGGRVLAQDRNTCLSFQMPLAAIETGAVDFVLPPEEIAASLVALVTVPGASDFFRVSPHFSLAHVRRDRALAASS